ncbi:hypothetical protein [Paenibacillus xylanexedens]|uniref:hypothetical protein n=1 Tax=Paenibacillus xylanexedens TaxID=528191 RepID=UPI001F43DF0D|nr:hypothetical protein [Paenibacillus xylanexedens]
MNKDELFMHKAAHDQLAEIAGSNIMITCEEVFEKSPQKPEVVGELLCAEGLKVFEGYQFLS